jgi:Tfp pilus assembly protein PilN
MINLIPNQEKKKKIRDFYFRLTVVAFFALAFSALVALVATLPAFLLSSAKLDLARSKLAEQEAKPLPPVDQETQKIIDGINIKMDLIDSAKKDRYLVSAEIVNEVLLRKLPTLEISQISYESDAKGKKVNVRGVARSREELLSFRRALEGSIAFKKVDLPISNFVQGSNIRFSLSLVPN